MVPFVLAGVWTLFALGPASAAEHRHRHDACRSFAASVLTRAARFAASSRKRAGCTSAGCKCSSCAKSKPSISKAPIRAAATSRVYRATLFSQRKFEITPQQAFETDVRLHGAGVGDALVCVAAQRGDLDARGARPDGPLGRFRAPISRLRLSRYSACAAGCSNPLVAAAGSWPP